VLQTQIPQGETEEGSGMSNHLYNVYFQQVNQSRYTVSAGNKEEAIEKAERLWIKENKYPLLLTVEGGSK